MKRTDPAPMSILKIGIANRGRMAIRVVGVDRELGFATVQVVGQARF